MKSTSASPKRTSYTQRIKIKIAQKKAREEAEKKRIADEIKAEEERIYKLTFEYFKKQMSNKDNL